MISYLGNKMNNAVIKLKHAQECRRNRSRINNTDFTILSNNCWGGFVYQKFGLEFTSPTIGLFMMERDYLKFVSDLKAYLSESLRFIPPEQSLYYEKLTKSGAEPISYPVARLRDIEVFFMHYKSQEEALEKWNRRRERINFDNLIVKLSQRSDCDDQTVKEFCALPYKKKICFTEKKYDAPCCVWVEGLKELNQMGGGDETPLTMKVFDVYELINRGRE